MPSLLHAALVGLFCLEGAILSALVAGRHPLLDRSAVRFGAVASSLVLVAAALALRPADAPGRLTGIAAGAILHLPLAVHLLRRKSEAGAEGGPALDAAKYERALGAEKRGDWDRAIENYRASLSGGPSDADVLRRIGEIEARRGRLDEAGVAFRQGIALARTPRLRLDLVLRVSEIEVDAGRRDRALAYLEDFLHLEWDESLRRLARARIEALSGSIPERRVIRFEEADGDPGELGQPFDRYRLLEEIGRGGMGIVWRAWDPVERRAVALKILVEEARRQDRGVERFLREVRAAARLDHPNIVKVHEVGVHEGQHFFTSELVEGISLTQAARSGLSIEAKARLVRGVAAALQHAHERGVVHRDVKPENVLVDAAGEPHVLDFGLAREIEAASGLTQSGMLLGTPKYMSPEQAKGLMKELDAASDQFSLGVVFYELLAGRAPFDADSLFLLLSAIIKDAPVPIRAIDSNVPEDLERICNRCLEKDPARRFRSMGELEAELAVWLGE